jgi:ubiquinone/menaquinone biosynthesis C-methylase UbiE
MALNDEQYRKVVREDPFAQLKAAARDGWSLFVALEVFMSVPAAQLVRFAGLAPGEKVLDVGCGTGVVALTAARAGARVSGLDLTPALLERARKNAAIAEVDVAFVEGDVEAMPYPDGSFDVVLSQFGHMFAPRPEVAVSEMLRVLRPGGRIAFTTWPPEHFTGSLFALVGRNMPAPPAGAPTPAPPPQWGDPNVVRARLGDSVGDFVFDRATMTPPVLSPQHARLMFETTLGPVVKLVAMLESQPDRLAQFRRDLDALIAQIFTDNHLRQHYLMSRAVKRRAL